MKTRRTLLMVILAIIALTLGVTAVKAGTTVTLNGPHLGGLVGWWRLNEGKGSTAYDSSGSGLTGTLQNSPIWSKGQTGKAYALTFDGSSQYITAADTGLPMGSAPRTVSFWYKTTSNSSNYPTMLDWGTSGTGGEAFDMGIHQGITYVSTWGPTVFDTTTSDDGLWHMMTVTFDGSNGTLYRDGKFSATGSLGSVNTISTGTLYIARDNAGCGSYCFPGSLDDIRIYNRALNASEVQQLYVGNEVLPSVTNKQSLSSLITYYTFDGPDVRGDMVADSSGNGNTGTRTPQLFAAGGNGFLVAGAGNSAANGNYIESIALGTTSIPYYELNSTYCLAWHAGGFSEWDITNTGSCAGPPLYETSFGTGNSSSPAIGTWTNPGFVGGGGAAPTVTALPAASLGPNSWATPGKLGQAMNFNGTSQYVAISSSTLVSNLSQLSVSAWVKTNTSGVYQGIVGSQGTSSGYHFQITSSNNLQLYLYGPNTGATGSTDLLAYKNKWVHVMGTYDGATIKVYVNGVLDGSTSATGAITSATTMRVGDTDDGTRFFSGAIDDVRIYNQALSGTQVTTLYKQQFGNQAIVVGGLAGVQMLVVAGGGGSGNDSGIDGGGGGGGLIYKTAQSISSGSYAVVVGSGGGFSSNGGDSTFKGNDAVGGGLGGGAGFFNDPGHSGGSGGGGSAASFGIGGAGGSGTAGQGNTGGAGGTANVSPFGGGGGGGGAGGAGSPGGSGVGGTGGVGLAYSITGSATYYASGGDGSSGGSGVSGAANTGDGGSGSGSFGGSGVVIIAYPGTVAKATGGTISTTSRPGYVVHTFTSSGTFHVN